MSSATPSAGSPAGARNGTPRRFSRFALQRLLGKSVRTMAWQVTDTRLGQELVLMLPRLVPQGADGLERWLQRARKAARLNHPQLAPAVELGAHDGWPYVTYELGEAATLTDRIGSQGLQPEEVAQIGCQLLGALAYAHDAGAAHRDLQTYSVLVNDKGQARLLGLEIVCLEDAPHAGFDTLSLRAQREAAEADVLQLGVLMHAMLTGHPALDEPDAGKAAERLPPQGREILRLAFSTPRPVPEALRVIVNRATDRQERQRYRSARTLAHALEGWLRSNAGNDGGPLALLLDRMRIAGVLPASPGGAERAARLALMERGRNDELAEVLLEDVALALELLRAVNMAQLRSGQVAGAGPVLTVRRAVAMLGLEGVRRVALALKPWPGPQAEDLSQAMARVRRAGRVAVAIRPAGYDSEVVYLVTLLQNLGRLVVQYHQPDDAAQIRRLMQPAPGEPGHPEDPGMNEQAASMAVLGVDLEALAAAVARWWGLDESVVHMMRRQSPSAGVRQPENDDEWIRITASCANEVVDAAALPAVRTLPALQAVVQRYGRALNLSLRDLQAVLQGAPLGDDRSAVSATASATASAAAPTAAPRAAPTAHARGVGHGAETLP
ncbi:MAG: HDOD domain-containing protein [Proteobacteria bacterium]|nr:HDOD domain-containing protein [Pseudomonadota bacterium]